MDVLPIGICYVGGQLLDGEHALQVFDEICTNVRATFVANGHVPKCAMLLCTREPDTNDEQKVVPIAAGKYVKFTFSFGDLSEDCFELGMRVLRGYAELYEAVFYIFISEAYGVLGEDTHEIRSGELSVSEHPNRIEVVQVHIEHRELGARIRLAPIKRSAGKPPELGEFFDPLQGKLSEQDGRICNVLPMEPAAAEA